MLMPRFGMDVVLAHPPEYALMPETVAAARENAHRGGGKFTMVNNMDEAFRDADVVIPKSWAARHMGAKPEESLRIAKQYTRWICDAERMKLARPDVLYMHPLPADRGNEVTDEVIDGPNSVVYQEAENRLHTAKAIMALTMADKEIEYDGSGMAETLVIALGGNAITRPANRTIPQQFAHTGETLQHLLPLFRGDSNLAIVHARPQIGNILIRVKKASEGCLAFRWTPASPIRKAAWAT